MKISSQEGRSQAALQRRGSLRRGSGEAASPGVWQKPESDSTALRRGSTEPLAKSIPRRGSAEATSHSRRGSREPASPSVLRRGSTEPASPRVPRRGSKEPTSPISFRRGSAETSSSRRSFRRGSAEPSSPQVVRRGSDNPARDQRLLRGGSVEPGTPSKILRPGSRESSIGSSFGILRRGSTKPSTSSQANKEGGGGGSLSRRGPALFNTSSTSSLASNSSACRSDQGKCAAAQHGSKRVIFFNNAAEPSKENENPPVSHLPKDSQFLNTEKEPSRLEESQQNSATTATRLSSPSPARSTGSPEENQRSATTRLSSPSPTRSSGSPDSGYSTVDLEPGSRALSLARLAVRVRDGEGEEVVAALHLLARLLEGPWGEEEAKVGSQIAPVLVNSYNAEETQVRKAALTCIVSLCLQVCEHTFNVTSIKNNGAMIAKTIKIPSRWGRITWLLTSQSFQGQNESCYHFTFTGPEQTKKDDNSHNVKLTD